MATLISGTDGSDTLVGTATDGDTLVGKGGNDDLTGLTKSIVFGGSGNDILRVFGGQATLYGGKDNDTLLGNVGAGSNVLFGDLGNDSLVGGLGDTLYGGAGKDTLLAGVKSFVSAGADNDSLVSASQATLYGGKGDDTLVGSGSGLLYGDLGNDNLTGKAGDTLISGDDNDTIVAQAAIFGLAGKGDDLLLAAAQGATLYGGQGGDTLMGKVDGDENTRGGNFLIGDKGSDSLVAGVGRVAGLLKADVLYGGADADILTPMKTADPNNPISDLGTSLVAYGGGGNDSIFGGEQGDSLLGEGPASPAGPGSEAGDTIGNDTIWGRFGKDFISGNAGNDLLIGGNEDDTIEGGQGNDSLLGGRGNDILTGGEGADSLWFVGFTTQGGQVDRLTGSDQITAIADLGLDTITGFVVGTDKIVLDGQGGSVTALGQGLFTALSVTTPISLSIVTASTSADTADGLMVYVSATGDLFYNPTTTANDAVRFAVLDQGLALSPTDFIIV
jgi:Ca2+-binding RTX toxin-like protein